MRRRCRGNLLHTQQNSAFVDAALTYFDLDAVQGLSGNSFGDGGVVC